MSSNSELPSSGENTSEISPQECQEILKNLAFSVNAELGSGKYDEVCNSIVEKTNAEAAFVLILNGSNGSGYSSHVSASANSAEDMAGMLESMAAKLRVDAENMGVSP